MDTNSEGVTLTGAHGKAAGVRRPGQRGRRASRPWRFQAAGSIKLALTLAVSVTAGTVIHASLRPHHVQSGGRNAVARPQAGGVVSLANLVENYAGLSFGPGAPQAAENTRKGSAKSSSHRRGAVARAPVARIAANPGPVKSRGGVHLLGRGAEHVGGFFSKPFRHKKSAHRAPETSSKQSARATKTVAGL
jgi:hypothetical protein